MSTRQIGIIMNGVTGRMGTNQHLLRSIVPIVKSGGIQLNTGESVIPFPLLVGRDEAKLRKLRDTAVIPCDISTDLPAALRDPAYPIYFDSQTTDRRVAAVTQAIAAGKHIYCEKPVAMSTTEALHLLQLATKAGVKHGVVQDKLWLPGLVKLKRLIDSNFFGQILSARGEFGYWVFDGHSAPAQRPSWNYRKQDGGGIIMDMLCHWRYIVDELLGEVRALSCIARTDLPTRWDESGKPYDATAEDSAFATFETAAGLLCHFNSSWCTRVRHDDLFTLQIDGTQGSAVAGLRDCFSQSLGETPRCTWNPDIENPIKFHDTWHKFDAPPSDNAFKIQWELFLKHVLQNDPFHWNLLAGAKGVQLGEKGLESWKKRAWVDVPPLN